MNIDNTWFKTTNTHLTIKRPKQTFTAILLFFALLIGLSVSVSACAKDTKANEPFQDAHIDSRNEKGAMVFTMPDGFSNGSTKCLVPGIRVTVIFKGDSPYGGVDTVADSNC